MCTIVLFYRDRDEKTVQMIANTICNLGSMISLNISTRRWARTEYWANSGRSSSENALANF